MSNVITVKNLGKKYTLRHQQQESYTALRDVITNGVSAIGKKILSPFTLHSSPSTAFKEDFWALKDVSFEVKQGDRIGIIGRNGAGKSTLLKILSRITEPTTGSVRIKGRVASLLEVGTGFHPELTGRENIFLNGAILGMSRLEIKKKFDEIVDFAEIEKFLDTPVKRYSSGMYVRLAFAVAAHLEPEILVVDEVLAVGDAQFQKKCLGKMEDVAAKEGRTVLFVSHNMAAVQQLCSRCVLLNNGYVRLISDSNTVVAHYYSFGSGDGEERSWPDLNSAPGDEFIRLSAARIVHDGRTCNSIPIDRDSHVEFEFFNLRGGHDDLSYSIHILDSSGYMVVCSNSIAAANSIQDPSAYLYGPLPVGKFKVSVKIPGNFLNDQVYRINIVVCSKTTIVHVYEKEVLSFSVYETGAMREANHGYWGGVVRPRIETQLIPLELGLQP